MDMKFHRINQSWLRRCARRAYKYRRLSGGGERSTLIVHPFPREWKNVVSALLLETGIRIAIQFD